MLTDAPPRKNRSGFLESDRIKSLDLPQNLDLQEIAYRLESAMKTDNIRDLRSACTEFLVTASNFYQVPTWCQGTSRKTSTQPRAWLIHVWMRTAVRKEVNVIRHIP